MPKKKRSKRAPKVRDLKPKKDTKGGIMAEWSRLDFKPKPPTEVGPKP